MTPKLIARSITSPTAASPWSRAIIRCSRIRWPPTTSIPNSAKSQIGIRGVEQSGPFLIRREIQVVLIAGLYAWFWFNLHGLALYGDDRPVLPRVNDLPDLPVAADREEEERGEHSRPAKVFLMFSRERAGQN